MKRARKQAYLIILAVIALVLAIIVIFTAHNLDIKALGVVAIVGGIAMVIVSLPDNGDK
jgi:peptidoglycan/LPS O-acetylase OafA/YrhL